MKKVGEITYFWNNHKSQVINHKSLVINHLFIKILKAII
nr:hypothetical protein [Enterococcus faecalis]